MNLSLDVTDDEIKNVLKDLFATYSPGEDAMFIDGLDREHLSIILNILSMKDDESRDKIWGDIEYNTIVKSDNILQKAHEILLSFREKVSNDNDNNDLNLLEKQFD